MPIPAGWPLFVVPTMPPAGVFVLDGPEGRHAATVRRLRVGEQLSLTDGAGRWAPATVTAVGRHELTVEVGDAVAESAPSPSITVVQALPKGERSDLAVDLTTEAGADVIVPWSAERCVAKWVGDKAVRGVDRWRQVAVEAAKQSRRTRFPTVTPLHSTRDVAALVSAAPLALILHEAESRPLRSVELTASGLVIVVGPEGGISDSELAALTAAGGIPVRLGPEVLRTSTAAAVALGALGALTSRWG